MSVRLTKNPCGNPNPQKTWQTCQIEYPHARVQIPFRGGYGVDLAPMGIPMLVPTWIAR